MRTITVASYFGTGSSAVTDFVSEFDSVYSLTDYEFRFVHDPDGLSDLEYNLVENHNRHNSGHALKRYKRLVNYYSDHWYVRRYEPFFANNWKIRSYEYINSLVECSFEGWWRYDYYDQGDLMDFLYSLPDRILHKTIWKKDFRKSLPLLPDLNTYVTCPTKEKFLLATRAYIRDLLRYANVENKQFLMVDQIVPPSNLERYLRYFDDIKVIIVDRDPRDQYLQSKYLYKDHIIPKDPIAFCKWFIATRKHRRIDHWDLNKVLFIRFEDLVYSYEKTTKEISAWLGLNEEDHKKKKKYFKPETSKKNTKLWEKYHHEKESISLIEGYLGEYLYKD